MIKSQCIPICYSISNLIMQKLNSKINEKQTIPQKLTSFIFQQVTSCSIHTNMQTMTKKPPISPARIIYASQSNQEPIKPKKDNMNPKNVIVSQHKEIQQKYRMKKIRRMTVSSKKQSQINNSRQQFFGDLSFRKSGSFHENGIRFNQNVEVLSPYLSRKISRMGTQPIKLNLKKESLHEVFDELQYKLRYDKQKESQEQMRSLQFQTLKSKRFQKLKQQLKNQQQNGEMISFDFDGSIINLEDQNNQKEFQIPQNINTQTTLHKATHQQSPFISNKTQKKKTINYQKKTINYEFQNNSYCQNQQKSLPFQATYKIKDRNSVSFLRDQSVNLTTKKFCSKKTQSIHQSSTKQKFQYPELPLNSAKQSFRENISLQSAKQQSLNNSQLADKIKNQGFAKVFKNTSSVQKNFRKQKEIKQTQQEKQKQFNNNFQRQTSTIPYLEINEGIRYQEQIKINSLQNNNEDIKIRFATIEKPRMLLKKAMSDRYNTSNENLTFRSYLPLTQSQNLSNNFFNKTISVFSQAVKQYEIRFDKKGVGKQQQSLSLRKKENEQFDFFDHPSKIIIKDQGKSSNQKTQRLKTTNVVINKDSNKNKFFEQFFAQKSVKNVNVFQLKQKILSKQKQRIMSSYTNQVK